MAARPGGQPGQLIHYSDAGSQHTSFKLATHLDGEGVAASIGSVGDAYDQRRLGGSRKRLLLAAVDPAGGRLF